MDETTLKEILKANAASQKEMMKNMFEMFKSMQQDQPAPAPTEGSGNQTVEFTVNSLANRLPEFNYDPENEEVFENWLIRFESILSVGGSNLNDANKAALVCSKLSSSCFSKLVNHISPRKPNELKFPELQDTLKKLFGPTSTTFSRRFAFFKLKQLDESLTDFAGRINRQHAMSQMENITGEQLKTLVLILGLPSADSDVRTRALRILEDKPETSLTDLTRALQGYVDMKADARLAEPAANVSAVQRQPKAANQSFKANQTKSRGSQAIAPRNQSKANYNSPTSVGVGADQTRSTTKHSPTCVGCGGQHSRSECPFRTAQCYNCQGSGHLAKVCRKPKTTRQANTINARLQSAETNSNQRILKRVRFGKTEIRMRLDTGADVTILSQSDWRKIGSPVLEPAKVSLTAADHRPIQVAGVFKCRYTIDDQTRQGDCYVADTTSLLGIDWLMNDPNFREFAKTCNSLTRSSPESEAGKSSNLQKELSLNFPQVFETTLGCYTRAEVGLHLKPDVHPVFRKARPVPFAVLPRVTSELQRLQQIGVLSPTNCSDWAAPIVVVQKTNGSIRLCADFSTGLNECIELHKHPLPTADAIFSSLNGGKFFTQIDLAEAYLQIPLNEEARNMLTINTHVGLFKFNRLPFGVKSAPGIFQQIIDQVVNGIPGTAAYLDDILVTGSTIQEHDERVMSVFRKLSESGFHVRKEKCTFAAQQVKFLGFFLDKHGRRPDPSRIEPILKMPSPQDVSQVKSFLGMVQFYGQFIPKLHELRGPLDKLTAKDTKFEWSRECNESFEKIKKILQSDLALTHFDPKLPLIVAADASNKGIGAVLTHRYPDGSEKAVCHISHALNKAQQNYSQIEKEGLALVFACQKFHKYIHGRQFTLRTDHKPLLTIFGSRSGIPVYTANRLQRWATMLLNYTFVIEYIRTTDFGQADALSRLIATSLNAKEPEDRVIALVEAETQAQEEETVDKLPVTAKMIRNATETDATLVAVSKFVLSGKWPTKVEKASTLWPYYNRKESLSLVNGHLLSNQRIVIPEKLRKQVLTALHRGHPGITRMKMLARSWTYWPDIDGQIEKLVKACSKCASAAKNPIKAKLEPWPTPDGPWSRIHIDHAGPLNGRYFLVVVDAYSKWPEIFATNSTATTTTTRILSEIFARFGNPKTIVSDNGTSFTANLFKEFCKSRGITQVHSPPYHPQSNGQAERFVDTFKRALVKMKDEGSVDENLQTFLQTYRSSPNPSTPGLQSPAEILFQRNIRTTLSLMKEEGKVARYSENNVNSEKMAKQFDKHHKAIAKHFQPGDTVYFKEYQVNSQKWVPGTITKRTGKVTYRIQNQDRQVIRHANQIRPRPTPKTELLDSLEEAFDLPSSTPRSADVPARQAVLLPDDQRPNLASTANFVKQPTTTIQVLVQPTSPKNMHPRPTSTKTPTTSVPTTSSTPIRRSSRESKKPKRLDPDPRRQRYDHC